MNLTRRLSSTFCPSAAIGPMAARSFCRCRVLRTSLPWATVALWTMMAAAWAMAFGPVTSQANAAENRQSEPAASFVEITPEVTDAVQRGLAFLAQQQNEDGSWGGGHYGRHVGITALAAMAFMADGHLPQRGAYGQVVDRATQFIVRSTQEDGLIIADPSHGPMYGHGFATLFLGEIYGQTQHPGVREALIKAVRKIVVAQNDEGGWRYQPVPTQADISVTICQIMALRSARNAGIDVPKSTIDKAIVYVRKCQNDDGGFRYRLTPGGSAFPRSAAGVASLYYAGVYEGKAIEQGLSYLMRYARGDAAVRTGGHYFYGQYYAVQAMYLAGGNYWRIWYPMARQQLLTQQRPDGRWRSPRSDAYGTSMALLVLQIPNRLLPIFQR